MHQNGRRRFRKEFPAQAASRQRLQVPRIFAAAKAQRLFSISWKFWKEKVDTVVNPPRKPVIKRSRASSAIRRFSESHGTFERSPIRKAPITFTRTVPAGKMLLKCFSVVPVSKKRAVPPRALAENKSVKKIGGFTWTVLYRTEAESGEAEIDLAFESVDVIDLNLDRLAGFVRFFCSTAFEGVSVGSQEIHVIAQ